MEYDEETLRIVQDALAKGRTIGDYVRGIELVWNEVNGGIQTFIVYKDDNDAISGIEKLSDLKAI